MKYFKYVVIVLIGFVLTGCVKYDTQMKINEDKSVELKMKYSIQNKNMETYSQNNETKLASNTEINLKDYQFLKKHGFSIEEFDETYENGEEASGIIISKRFRSLDEITSDQKLVIDFFKIFKQEDTNYSYDKFFYKEDNKYTASYIFDLTPTVNGTSSNNLNIDYTEYSNMFDFKYSITLPDSVKYVESNATKISDNGKTLIWNLELGKKNKVEFGFSFDNYIKKIDKIFLYSSLGSIVISLLFIIIISLTKLADKKKIKVEDNISKEESNKS